MAKRYMNRLCPLVVAIFVVAVTARAQSFQVQCPTSTITHPASANPGEPSYTGPTVLAPGPEGSLKPTSKVNGAIKCQQISGGDGYATMGDGTQTYLFSFGPLSGLADMAKGLPGTQFPNVFNQVYGGAALRPGDPATTDGGTTSANLAIFTYNGAIGLVPDADNGNVIDGHVDPRQIMDV